MRVRSSPSLSLLFPLLLLPLVSPQERPVSIQEAVDHALNQSQLTRAGSPPFHLKAEISEPGHAASSYKAQIEEYWLSPGHWRRTLDSPDFSQTLVADGGKISELDKGDYYPFWLRDLVTAIFEPLPMYEQLRNFKGQLEVPADSTQSSSCLQFASPAGIAPVRASLGYAFCFQGKTGLLQNVSTPAYKARFEDYQPHQGKLVARRIIAQLDPGTTLEARVTELDDDILQDRSLFTVDQPTPAANQLKSTQVGESTARNTAVHSPAILWPAVREGKTSGTLSAYISNDKAGQVREVWTIASENPELNSAVRDQLRQWRFQPYVNGVPMQMEAVLTFAFEATRGEPIPLLTDAQARNLASHRVEPRDAQKTAARKKYTVRIRVDQQGKLVRVLNPNNLKPPVFSAAERALKQWQFRPYLRGGKPDLFDADITFAAR